MSGPAEYLPNRLASPRVKNPLLIAVSTVGVVVAAALFWHFLLYLQHAIGAVWYPFAMDYGEGIVWQQALLIPGPRMYGDITQFPFIVFHYPPLYHLVVRALAATGVDMLVAGRCISLISTLVVGGVVARLAFFTTLESVGRVPRVAGSMIAGLTIFCYGPVVTWSLMMRVDLLALALGFLGVWCAVTSIGHPWRLAIAAAFFVLAMFTKQTSIAPPMATLLVVLLIDPRRSLLTSLCMVLTGLAGALFLNEYTDGGFLRHILLYNLNRFDFRLIMVNLGPQWPHLIFALFAVAGVVAGWRQLITRRHWANWRAFTDDLAESIATRCVLIMTIYLVIATMMLVMTGKSGASSNYVIEGMCVWSVFIGTIVATIMDRAIKSVVPARPMMQNITVPVAFGLGWLLVAQMMVMPTAYGEYRHASHAYLEELESLRSRIANLPGPVLSDDMVLLLRAGKEVPWEPAIFAELASQGRWDQQLIIDRIKAHKFAIIVTTGQPGTPLYNSRYTPEVNRAIESAYPRTEQIAGRTVHFVN